MDLSECPAQALPVCSYCGGPADTQDHVVPRCLFLRPLPPFMLTVPSCDPCNKRKAKDEDYLRDVLVTDVFCSDQPVPKVLLEGKVARSAQSNRSDVAKAARKYGRPAPLYTPGGIYLGQTVAVPLDDVRFMGAIEMIVRGLYFQRLGHVFPSGYEFDLRRVKQLSIGDMWTSMLAAKANGPYRLGDVFVCMFLYGTEDPAVTMWVLSFYNNFVLTVSTEPQRP